MMRFVLILLASGAWGMGRTPPKTTPVKESAVDQNASEWKGQFCGINNAHSEVIRNIDDWKRLWDEAFKKPAPPADFSKVVGAAVFLGAKQTGGYGVDFQDPAQRGGVTVLLYREKAPGPGSFVIQAFTQPYAIKLFPKPAGDVALEPVK